MANTKISQLPIWSGTAADLRWFVMNNSGQTETFKFSGYTSPFKVATGTNNTNNIYDTNVMAGSNNIILGGDGTSIIGGTATHSSIIGCIGSASITSNQNLGIYSSYGGLINGASYRSAVIACYGSNITYGTGCAIIGSYARILGTNNGYSVILGGIDNTMTTVVSSAMLGGDNQTMTSSNKSAIIGGNNSTISSKNNVVMLGTSGRTATTSSATFVENLVVFNYSNLNYADDTAAAAGGVVLGQLYHTGGIIKVRIV